MNHSNKFSLISLIYLIRKWLRPVIIACVAAAIISAIIALLLPVKFKSTAIFYPSSARNANPEWIFAGQEKIEVNLSTADIDRILTISESRDLAKAIVLQYGLLKDYEIDTTNNPMGMQYALEEFKSNYTITQTSRDAIEVSFMHSDSEKAAIIANAIVKKIGELNSGLTRENKRKILELHEKRFNQIAKQFAAVRDSLMKTRQRYNMFSEDRQSRELSERVTEAEARLKEAQGELEVYSKSLPDSHPKMVELKAEINGQQKVLDGLLNPASGNAMSIPNYTQSVDKVEELNFHHADMISRYNNAKGAYTDAKVSFESDISSLYIVQEATPSPKKASPIRWLIVAGTTLATFFCCLVLITLYEVYRNETQKVMA